MSESSADEGISLSAETFNALQEFYSEQEEREHQKNSIGDVLSSEDLVKSNVNEIVSEDWQLSQFWYSEETAQALAEEAIRASNGGLIACISCPTLYIALKKYFPQCEDRFYLFEYDRRFMKVAGSKFVFYDYKSPLDIPRELRDDFSLVVADPPFLSDECLTKTAVTVKYLSKDKIICCTGKKMADMCDRLLGLTMRKFTPKHRNNLANEFACFSNYEEIDHHQ
eukprot:TRINITY_DN3053_c0_g1_i2.p1 TRINITY_DN3053_c0_g1~~TRINITY_DN3053_c0_g1_i2.p1  ORF type:complete len:225 (+),score=66.58 TRINITY_DN3053_c0_g1_i2:40-714(+)